jgi:hypothetical protein
MGNKKTLIAITLVIVLVIILLIIYLPTSSDSPVFNERKPQDKNALVGDWVRTDASYLIKIKSIKDNGFLEANYFNPRPINVESANWEEVYRNLKVTIILRDVNYPGSKYSLTYLPDRDMLAGEYFQAVEGLTFYVEFVRNK